MQPTAAERASRHALLAHLLLGLILVAGYLIVRRWWDPPRVLVWTVGGVAAGAAVLDAVNVLVEWSRRRRAKPPVG